MEVKTSGKISDLRVEDFQSLVRLNDIQAQKNGPSITDKIEVNSMFSSATIKELREASTISNNKLYSKILRMLDTYHPMPMPPARIKIEGQVYELIKDFAKLKTGWYVDVSHLFNVPEGEPTLVDEHPELLVAMCYIEEGMEYAQQDKNKNIINLSKDRAKVFKEHFKLNHFIDLTTFFLRVWVEWKGTSIQSEMRQKELNQLREKLRLLNGKLQLMK